MPTTSIPLAPVPTGPDLDVDRPAEAIQPANPAHVILTVEDLQARYPIRRDKSYELVRQPGFLRSLVPGDTWIGTLEALTRWELASQLVGTVAALNPTAPTPPAPARPGPKGGR